MTIYTSGYEGEKIDGFLHKLLQEGITVVVDVREHPFSRKPGFSKKALQEKLAQVGIQYKHYKELGTPKPLRNFLKEQGDYQTFFAEYSSYLEEYRESILDIAELAVKEKACILCFEKDAHLCHRMVVSKMVEHYSNQQLQVEHL